MIDEGYNCGGRCLYKADESNPFNDGLKEISNDEKWINSEDEDNGEFIKAKNKNEEMKKQIVRSM